MSTSVAVVLLALKGVQNSGGGARLNTLPARCNLCISGTSANDWRYFSGTSSPVPFHQWVGYTHPTHRTPAYSMPSVYTAGLRISPENQVGRFFFLYCFGFAVSSLNQLAHH